MAKYIVLDSKFNPMSFEDRIAPYKDYYTNAQTQLQAVADLETKAATLKQIADTHPEWQQEYNNYMAMLTNVRDTMYNYGVDGNLVKDVLKANKAFTEMSSMATADGQKRALTDGLNKLIQQDATAFTSIEGEEPTAYDLRKNPYADQYKTMSGAQLQANVENKAKHYAEQMDQPDFYNTEKGILTNTIKGYNPQQMAAQITLIESLLSDATFASSTNAKKQATLEYYADRLDLNTQLLNFVQQELEASGVYNWSKDAKRKAIHYITNGLWAGVGGNTWDLQKSSSSDSGGDKDTSKNINLNFPGIAYIGEYHKNSNKDYDGSLSLDNSKAQNMEVLYRKTDINGNITFKDGTSVNFNDLYRIAENAKNHVNYYDSNNNDTMENNYNNLKTANQVDTKQPAKLVDGKIVPNHSNLINKIKSLYGLEYSNDEIEVMPSETLYQKIILEADPKKLSKQELQYRKDLELVNKANIEAEIDFYSLEDYLNKDIINDILEYGVHQTYEYNTKFGSFTTKLVPVSTLDKENPSITDSLYKHLNDVVFESDDFGMTLSGTKGITVQQMLDDMISSQNKADSKVKESLKYTVYLNPALLHYDNYGNNKNIADSYILEYKDRENKIHRYVVKGEYLGSNYESLLLNAQSIYNANSNWVSVKPDSESKNPYNRYYTDDAFYTNILEQVVNIRNQNDITSETSR